jgi:hypothetical protein
LIIIEFQGPLQDELRLKDFKQGFHVNEKKIKHIAERAYSGIYEYMHTFVATFNTTKELEINCSQAYSELMGTFSGYWSK